ncbi:hypothetical protein FA13DRAFT_1733464 [Coprinellus micaceus]|uniref:Uncharacterized protein n=1 Tax=Coprinellus micaceus TaxID=71717 RepID=A0A4Y7TAL6_COPMI|nr:hypothetical protein FA13DRAFT_1733464 [Coprinellus micaceus]
MSLPLPRIISFKHCLTAQICMHSSGSFSMHNFDAVLTIGAHVPTFGDIDQPQGPCRAPTPLEATQKHPILYPKL